MYICIYVYVYTCIHTCIHLSLSLSLYIYINKYIYIYIYINIYTHVHSFAPWGSSRISAALPRAWLEMPREPAAGCSSPEWCAGEEMLCHDIL